MSMYEFTKPDYGREYILNGLSSMPGGFFIYRADWKKEEILYANQSLLDMFECSDTKEFLEVTGGTFRGIVHPDDYERIESEIRYQISSSDDHFDKVHYRILTKTGRVVEIEDYGRYIEDPWEGPLFYVFVSSSQNKKPKENPENIEVKEFAADNERTTDALDRAIRIASILNRERNYDFAMNNVLKELKSYIHGDFVYILAVDPETNKFTTAFDIGSSRIRNKVRSEKEDDMYMVYRGDSHLRRENDYIFENVDEVKEQSHYLYHFLQRVGARNILQVPIYNVDETIGFLGVFNIDKREVPMCRRLLIDVSYSIAFRMIMERMKNT